MYVDDNIYLCLSFISYYNKRYVIILQQKTTQLSVFFASHNEVLALYNLIPKSTTLRKNSTRNLVDSCLSSRKEGKKV